MAEQIIHFRQKLHNRHLRQHNSQTISPTHPRSYILFLWMLFLNSTYSGLAGEVFWALSSNYYLKVRICQAFIWVTSENLLWIGIWAQRNAHHAHQLLLVCRSGNSWARSEIRGQGREIRGQGRKFVGKVGNSWARSAIRGNLAHEFPTLPTNFRPCPRISDLAHEFPTLPTNFPTLPTNFRPCPRIFRPCPRISRPCPRISVAFKFLCEGEGLGFRV